MRPTKVNKRTLPKRKPAKAAKPEAKQVKQKVTLRQAQGTKKVKPKFSLKGIPVKYKHICNLAIEHADTQTQCDELLLVGVNAYEILLESHTAEQSEKLKLEVVTKAILTKKETYAHIAE